MLAKALWLTRDQVDRITEALAQVSPQHTGNLRELGQGFTSTALESDDGFVFSVAKDDAAARNRRVAMALLPEIGPTLPVPVPRPEWSIDSAPGLEYGAFAYRKLPGRTLASGDTKGGFAKSLVEDIASFLVALHAFPADRALALGIRDANWQRVSLSAAHASSSGYLSRTLLPHELRSLEDWRTDFLNDRSLWSQPGALIHCDFWYDNLLVNEDATRVTGVLDFAEAAVWDVAHDFATLRAGGDAFAIACIEAYKKLGGDLGMNFLARVERHTEHWEGSLAGLEIALRFDDQNEAAESIEKLRASPVLNPEARNLLRL